MAAFGVLLAAHPASAALSSATLAGSTATLTFDGADDVLTVDDSGGRLRHNAIAGLETVLDWSSAAGEQTLPATTASLLVLNFGAGADTAGSR